MSTDTRPTYSRTLLNQAPVLLMGALLMVILIRLSLQPGTYLLFHVLAELFSIVIAFTIFLLTWNARGMIHNGYLLVLGLSFLFTGGLDLLHALAFRGMNVLPGTGSGDPNGANLATQLWLAARAVQSLTLAAAPLFFRRRPRHLAVLLAYSLLSTLLLAAIFVWRIFPDALLDVGGLTRFKIYAEYAIIAGFFVGLLGLRRVRAGLDARVFRLMQAAISVTILSELAFTAYLSEYDWMNAVGHFLKIVAFALVYRAIIEIGFRQPQQMLFRELTEREAALRESEDRERARAAQLEAIMDAAPAVVWIAHDADARRVTGNRASYETLRIPQGQNQSLSAPPEEAPQHFKVYNLDGQELALEDLPLQRAASTGQPVREFEEVVVFEDGERRRLYGNVSPLLDEDGNPAGAVGAFIDITARLRVEEALQASEERYRSLFENMGEALLHFELLLDEQGQPHDLLILEVNSAFEQMTSVRRDQVVGQSVRGLSPALADDWITRYAQVAFTGEAQRFEDYSVPFDKYFDVLIYRTGPLRVASLTIDVSERVRSQQAQQQSEARLRRLVEANIIGITYFDAEGRVQLANDAFLRIVGYTRAEFEAGEVNLLRMTPAEHLPADRAAMDEAQREGACEPYEKAFLRRDGAEVPVLIGFAYFAGPAAPFISFVVDLTRQKQAELSARMYAAQLERFNRELTRANDELQEFAFVASHDLQEPLRKIQAFGERLVQHYQGGLDEEGRDYLQRMLNASVRMRAMIEAMLSLSRVTTRGQPFQNVDLNVVIAEVLSDLEVRIEATGGQVSTDALPTIQADPTQMHQLFQNLIVNALKFHRPGVPPRVRLSSQFHADKKSVTIYVEDNGIGFDEQYAERIFQPFQRLHGRAEYEGSGIGLAVCRKIVERHSGTLNARSQEHQGTTFIVTLPVQQAMQKDNKEPAVEDGWVLKDRG